MRISENFPHLDYEHHLLNLGHRFIAGLDEVGRGSWAGPVVAAAVILIPGQKVPGLKDSKLLTPDQRNLVFEEILSAAMAIGTGVIAEGIIDCVGIISATRLAMQQAILNMRVRPDFLLIDALDLPQCPIPQQVIIEGDRCSASIAAASVVAKVTRDRILCDLDALYPDYCFARNKGYGTREHQQALQRLGPCEVHRRSFSPVKIIIQGTQLKIDESLGAGDVFGE